MIPIGHSFDTLNQILTLEEGSSLKGGFVPGIMLSRGVVTAPSLSELKGQLDKAYSHMVLF